MYEPKLFLGCGVRRTGSVTGPKFLARCARARLSSRWLPEFRHPLLRSVARFRQPRRRRCPSELPRPGSRVVVRPSSPARTPVDEVPVPGGWWYRSSLPECRHAPHPSAAIEFGGNGLPSCPLKVTMPCGVAACLCNVEARDCDTAGLFCDAGEPRLRRRRESLRRHVRLLPGRRALARRCDRFLWRRTNSLRRRVPYLCARKAGLRRRSRCLPHLSAVSEMP